MSDPIVLKADVLYNEFRITESEECEADISENLSDFKEVFKNDYPVFYRRPISTLINNKPSLNCYIGQYLNCRQRYKEGKILLRYQATNELENCVDTYLYDCFGYEELNQMMGNGEFNKLVALVCEQYEAFWKPAIIIVAS